ncbi:hypothetical protein, variant 1 [Aphanomyces invadans]|uniref:RING-type domain-containing protein n=2 Tax=Aphanomyces invadans TaxID=157072 RepID=A0A024US06_9STRA|nr:hypothetical protein, variant 1 [Aphanomyces invadans]ETW08388.1 hypothetical protein, variant 1 [Aphanomyces invadans]|eukprot:XP_008862194.1 hypothetical protein, variant 1 [Aphanomyces invadans]
MGRRKQAAPKRQAPRKPADDADASATEQPSVKKAKLWSRRSRSSETTELPISYHLQPLSMDAAAEWIHVRLPLEMGEASNAITSREEESGAYVVSFVGKEDEAYTDIVLKKGDQAVEIPPPWAAKCRPEELTAMAFLNSKKCLAVEIDGRHARFGIHMTTYTALRGNRNLPSATTLISKHMGNFMRWLIRQSKDEWTFPYMSELADPSTSINFDPTVLYKFIPSVPTSQAGEEFEPSPNLLSTLRPYQKAAVAWMLQREALPPPPPHNATNAKSPPFAALWARHASGVEYNPFTTLFRALSDVASVDGVNSWNVRGGILADEMGLGKTVQVLACILSHPSPPVSNDVDQDNAVPLQNATVTDGPIRSCVCNSHDEDVHGWLACVRCGMAQHRVCTGFVGCTKEFYCEGCLRRVVPDWAATTTLIISPESIHKQWKREILRHTKPDSISIMSYGGIKSLRQRLKGRPSPEWKYCRAPELAKFDVVLTTYEALKDDLHHVAATEESTLRQRKRYRIVASPLTHVKWWRICMDEAQLVENTQTKASLMALALKSTLRWCVSGTPFSADLADVYGTLAFLQAVPFHDKAWWRAVMVPFAATSHRLGHLMQHLMWRNEKKNVLDQINLPPQTIEVTWLDLSNIETHFYHQQLEECTKHRLLPDTTEHNEITPAMINSLMRLRQACCHPQVGSNGLKALDGNQPMKMDEVLAEMLQKAQRECEEAQRILLAVLNGLAALNVLEGAIDVAVGQYYEALCLVQHNWADIHADLLPRLHLVYNFGRLLGRYCGDDADNVPHSVPYEDAKTHHCLPQLTATKPIFKNFSVQRDCATDLICGARRELAESATRIELYYLQQCNLAHDTALHKYETAFNAFQADHFPDVDMETQHVPDSFHSGWMEALDGIDDDVAFIDRVRAKLMSRYDTGAHWSQKMRTAHSLRMVLVREFDRMFLLRAVNHQRLMALSRTVPTKQDIDISGNCSRCREGRDGPTCHHCKLQPQMDALRSMLGIADTDAALSASDHNLASLLMDITTELVKCTTSYNAYTMHERIQTMFGDMRKERILAMKLWKAQHARLGALDELEMAKTTLQLRQPYEPIRDAEKLYKLLPVEVPLKRMELEQEKVESSANLASKLSQLRYLLHLHRMRDQSTSGGNDDQMCVVCHERMRAKRGVWPCAHVFCMECTHLLIQRAKPLIRCPTCRSVAHENRIVFIQEDSRLRDNVDSGGHGTKIDSIVRRIQSMEAGAKCLMFSQWPDMLKLMHQALVAAGVHCFLVQQKRDFDKTLELFKQYPEGCVLAIPFKHGANGLNVVEANHVILIEPLLHPGVEAQAINRIHRIGQDKSTTVHKFVVRNSVEESILVLQEKKKCITGTGVTKSDKERVTWTDWAMLLQLVRGKLVMFPLTNK